MSIVKLTPATNGGSVQLKAPNDTSGTDVVLTLPNSDGNADQYLKTDGSGALSWGTVSTAEQDASTGDYTLTSGDLKFATDVKGIRFNGNSSTGYIISDTTSSNAIITNVGGNLNSWSWRFGGTEKFTFTSTGNIAFASGNGIDFGATSNTSASGATMANELLDDYEEGTWTPYLYGHSSAGTGTYPGTSTWGKYTKVGDIVNCIFNIYSSAHTGSGGTYLAGMPFTSISANTHFDVPIGGESLNCGSDKTLKGHLHQGDVKCRVMAVDYEGGGDAGFLSLENGNMYISGSFTYLAA